jgi:hypothetical protein
MALREAFLEAVRKERRDVKVAAASLAVLTLIGTLLLAVVLAAESAKGGFYYPWIAAAVLVYVFAAFLVSNDTDRADRPWTIAAGALMAPAVLLAPTPLPRVAPSLYWILFASGALAGFGCLGMAYRWREPYLGLRWGPHTVDDPTTLRDDRDRAHLGVATFAAPARLLVGGIADLAGRGWMRQALDPADVDAAVTTLERLAVHDRKDVDRLLRPRTRLWLSKMGLIRRGEAGWALTRDGERLAGSVEEA